jgi:ATP-dependent helicase/nuclease subunit B
MKNLEYYTLPLSANVIEEIIDYVLKNYSVEEFNKVCIIFGGKRPSTVFKKHLSMKLQQNILPPKIFSVEEFIYYIVSKQEKLNFVSDLEIIYLLYKILAEIQTFNNKFSSFINFIPWGYEIYSFLEEMMLENIKPQQLINLTEESLFGIEIPPSIKDIVKNISDIYVKFYDYLINQKFSTRGVNYKLASEYSAELQLEEFDKIIIVTPFYLHRTELNIISNLVKNNKVVIFFQGNQTEWKQLENIANYFNISIQCQKEDDKIHNIYFYSVFDNISEVNCVHTILKNISSDELDKTVVVLPLDETATLLLNSLPDNVKDYNLVCGYPLKRNVIVSLLKTIFDLQITKKENKYYTKYYIEIIKNPLIRNVGFDKSSSENILQSIPIIFDCIEDVVLGKVEDNKISKSNFVVLKDIQQSKVLFNHIYEMLSKFNLKLKIEDIAEIITIIHKKFFVQWEKIRTVNECCKCLKETLNFLLSNSNIEKNMLNLYSVNKLFEIIEELENLSFTNEKFSKEEIFKFFLIQVDRAKLSFIGSPVKGLQMLGFYETRNLNFDKVIICDINEGVLPHLEQKSVLVPYTFLTQLGINRLEIEEELQRYHFKRLVLSAKDVYLVYIESNEKEKSRFVEQMVWDIQKKEKTLNLKNMYSCYFPVSFKINKREVKKTEDVIEYLKNFCYSPTAVDTYLTCPLKFHYTYVLGLEEQEVLSDEPEGKEIGEFIHSLLEESFKVFIQPVPQKAESVEHVSSIFEQKDKSEHQTVKIDEEFKKKFFILFEQKFDSTLAKRYKTESFLVKKVMKFYLEQFLFFEQQRIQKDQVEQILMLEQNYKEKIFINGKQIFFQYRIDRVDKLQDGSLLVIDYKTGYIPQMNKNLNIDQLSYRNIKKQIKSFQLPLYVDIIQKKLCCENVDAMFYNIKEPDKPYRLFKDSKYQKKEIIDIVFSSLDYIFDEILNPEIPFYEDIEEPQNCNQCPFQYLCR